MNNLQNGVNLIGRAGQDPIVRTFENGVKLARFALATNEIVTEVNGKKKQTQWHTIVAWGKKAELIERFVKKGQMMAIEGKLVNRVYRLNEGGKAKSTEVQANEVLLINPKRQIVNKKLAVLQPTPEEIKAIKKAQVKQLSETNTTERKQTKKAS